MLTNSIHLTSNLYTSLSGRGDKLELKHKGPHQVMNKLDSIYTIQDLVNGKIITNLREFRTDPKDVAVQNKGEFLLKRS